MRIWSASATEVSTLLSAANCLTARPLKKQAGTCAGFLLALALHLLPSASNATETRYGTGFFVDTQGHLITALHVVTGSKEVRVYLQGETTPVLASVLKTNAVSDLALLKVESPGAIAPVAIETFTQTPVGMELFALGYPRPSIHGRDLKITSGLLTSDKGFHGATNQFQFSAPMDTGHSGGPIMNSEGKVIGVAIGRLRSSQGPASQQTPNNVGVALRSEALLRFLSGTPVDVTVGKENPPTTQAKSAVDTLRLTAPSVVLVEASIDASQRAASPPGDIEKSHGSKRVGPGAIAQHLDPRVQLLVNQGFREPARTSIGFLLMRMTGRALASDSGTQAIEAELMTSMDTSRHDKLARPYQSSLSRLGYDCASNKMSVLSRTLHVGPFLSGEVIDRQLAGKLKWSSVPSKALENYLRSSLCQS